VGGGGDERREIPRDPCSNRRKCQTRQQVHKRIIETCQQLETFLENVHTILGEDSVIKLLLHKEDQSQEMIFIQIVLLCTKSNDSSKCVSRYNYNVLPQEKQVELGQQLSSVIDPFFKDKTPNSLTPHQ
jgi:hypothetical protein